MFMSSVSHACLIVVLISSYSFVEYICAEQSWTFSMQIAHKENVYLLQYQNTQKVSQRVLSCASFFTTFSNQYANVQLYTTIVMFSEINAKLFETSSKTGHGVGEYESTQHTRSSISNNV